jgi:hypothetical protein
LFNSKLMNTWATTRIELWRIEISDQLHRSVVREGWEVLCTPPPKSLINGR